MKRGARGGANTYEETTEFDAHLTLLVPEPEDLFCFIRLATSKVMVKSLQSETMKREMERKNMMIWMGQSFDAYYGLNWQQQREWKKKRTYDSPNDIESGLPKRMREAVRIQ